MDYRNLAFQVFDDRIGHVDAGRLLDALQRRRGAAAGS
jgi:hypothetical protein